MAKKTDQFKKPTTKVEARAHFYRWLAKLVKDELDSISEEDYDGHPEDEVAMMREIVTMAKALVVEMKRRAKAEETKSN